MLTQERIRKVISFHSFGIFFFLLIFYSMFHMPVYCPQEAVAQSITRNNFTTYEDPAHKIKIEYPSNWTKKNNLTSDNIVAFRPPPDTYGKYAGTGLGVYVHKLHVANISLEDYSNEQLDYLKNQSFTISKSDNTTLAHHPGTNVTYRNDLGLQALMVWTIMDDKAYVIVYLAEKGKYNHYLSSIQTMIDSFEIQSNSVAHQLSDKAIEAYVCDNISLDVEDIERFCD
jgi:PsbP-like protein